MIHRIGSLLLLGLLVWGGVLYTPTVKLNASESSMAEKEIVSSTIAVNVKHVVRDGDHKGVLEISHQGIAYVSEHTVWVQSIPWNRILEWKCFGSKHVGPDEADLCTLWIQVERGSPASNGHLFFKAPCEIIPGKENWEIVDAYDPRARF